MRIFRLRELLWSMAGAAVALVPTLALMQTQGLLFLPSIGGSVIFVFALTHTPAAQPRALWIGHLGSAAIGIGCAQILGQGISSLLIASLAGMAFMVWTRTVHPPAGANPLVMVHAGAQWHSLAMPLASSLLLVSMVGWAWSRIRPGIAYPSDWVARSPPD